MDSTSIIKSAGGISSVSTEARHMLERRVFLEGDITQESAMCVIKKLMLLIDQDPGARIDIFINSPGGDINAGMILYDFLQSVKTPVRVTAMGRAYSMAAVIVACGRHGRYVLPSGELMLHEPLLGNRVGGSSSSLKSISDSLQETKRRMNRLLARHTRKSEKAIAKACSYDHYFSAEEAVAFGLCDGIITFDEIMKEERDG